MKSALKSDFIPSVFFTATIRRRRRIRQVLCYAFFLCSHPLQNRSLFSVRHNRFSVIIKDTLIVQHRNPGPVADVFEWGAVCIFLGSGVIEYLVPVGEVSIRIDLCQTFIGRNDKIIWNDNGVGFCVCKLDRQIFELQNIFIGNHRHLEHDHHPGRPPQRRIYDRHAVKTVYGCATGESEIKMWERNLEIRFCI